MSDSVLPNTGEMSKVLVLAARFSIKRNSSASLAIAFAWSNTDQTTAFVMNRRKRAWENFYYGQFTFWDHILCTVIDG